MKSAEETLEQFGIETDVRVISAHRTPERLTRFLAEAEEEGVAAIILGESQAKFAIVCSDMSKFA